MRIAITGGDGAGKSVVVRQVVERLAELRVAARRVDRWDVLQSERHPTARFLTSDIESIRTSLIDMPKTPRFLFLLWLIALSASGEECERHYGGATILDGYWMKHAASEIACGMDRQWIESVVSGLPHVELVLYLRLEPHDTWLRKQGRLVPYECGMDASCSRESFIAHQRRILAQLDAWSAEGGWTVIDAAQPLQAVVATSVMHILRGLETPVQAGHRRSTGR